MLTIIEMREQNLISGKARSILSITFGLTYLEDFDVKKIMKSAKYKQDKPYYHRLFRALMRENIMPRTWIKDIAK